MGFVHLIVVGLAFTLGAVFYEYHQLAKPLPAPKLDTDAYWGRGSKDAHKPSTAVKQFQIKYSEEVIGKLKGHLSEPIVLHEPLENVGFEYGVNSKHLIELIDYWRDNYLSRWFNEREKFFNQFAHFKTEIQGLNVHFIHAKANRSEVAKKKTVPLLLIHGWPGSVREFYEFIPKLQEQNDDLDVVFDVVAPSLPGYGWSDGAAKQEFGVIEMSVVLRNLMIRLGYDKFYIQGGDWGSALGSSIATLFPENVLGYHSNMCFTSSSLSSIKQFIASLFPSLFIPKDYEDFHFPSYDKFTNLILESGYMHIQATKPDTIGIALTGNPIGLLAYILEKFSTWTDPSFRSHKDGGFAQNPIQRDAILDNMMIYYLTNSITTSVRLYAEAFSKHQRAYQLERVPTAVPTGCARFKNDIAATLDWQLAEKYTQLVHSTYHRPGGHFIALEAPDVLYNDFVEFIKKARKV